MRINWFAKIIIVLLTVMLLIVVDNYLNNQHRKSSSNVPQKNIHHTDTSSNANRSVKSSKSSKGVKRTKPHTAKSSLEESTLAIQRSMEDMRRAMERKQALKQVEVLIYDNNVNDNGISKNESRELLLKAGYNLDDQRKYKLDFNNVANKNITVDGSPELVKQDIEFAQGVAKDYVKQEIDDFLEKVKLVTKLGKYISQRVKVSDK